MRTIKTKERKSCPFYYIPFHSIVCSFYSITGFRKKCTDRIYLFIFVRFFICIIKLTKIFAVGKFKKCYLWLNCCLEARTKWIEKYFWWSRNENIKINFSKINKIKMREGKKLFHYFFRHKIRNFTDDQFELNANFYVSWILWRVQRKEKGLLFTRYSQLNEF